MQLCAPHYGIGGDGIVLIEKSGIADAKMRSFNKDGSEGKMAGNNIRCVAKYLYDKGYVRSEYLTIEMAGQVHHLKVYLRDGKVNSVSVNMGKASFAAKDIPVLADTDEVVNQTISIGGKEYPVTCVSVGNPHCVVFCDAIDGIDLSIIGPQFEYADIFPERVNTEFARVINKTTLRLRVWERGSGETLACGTGACAAVAVAVRLGLLPAGKSIDVKLPGGILSAIYTENSMHLTGDTLLTFEGCFVY